MCKRVSEHARNESKLVRLPRVRTLGVQIQQNCHNLATYGHVHTCHTSGRQAFGHLCDVLCMICQACPFCTTLHVTCWYLHGFVMFDSILHLLDVEARITCLVVFPPVLLNLCPSFILPSFLPSVRPSFLLCLLACLLAFHSQDQLKMEK